MCLLGPGVVGVVLLSRVLRLAIDGLPIEMSSV